MPLVALAPAWLFAKSSEINITVANRIFANDIWKGKSYEDAITGSQQQVSFTYWSTLLLVFLLINSISLLKYLWHFVMRKFSDRLRKDGKTSGPAPIQFFIFHTSGVASWFGATMLAFSIVNMFFPERPFTVIFLFFDGNLLWQFAVAMVFLLFIVKYYQSNTEIFMELYKSEKIVGIVRRLSLVIPIILFISTQIAGMFSLMWLAQKARMTEAL